MSPKEGTEKFPQSFSRVFILVYLLCVGHPSSGYAISKECLDADFILGLVGSGSIKDWAKIILCVTEIFEETLQLESVTAKNFSKTVRCS